MCVCLVVCNFDEISGGDRARLKVAEELRLTLGKLGAGSDISLTHLFHSHTRIVPICTVVSGVSLTPLMHSCVNVTLSIIGHNSRDSVNKCLINTVWSV